MTPGHPAQTRVRTRTSPAASSTLNSTNPEVTQLSHALPGIVFLHGPAEQPVVRVLADARQRPDQDIERFRGQAAHLAERPLLQPRPVAHVPGWYSRRASSSSMPPPVPARVRSQAS